MRWIRLLLAGLVAASSATAEQSAEPFRLGVQTHFEQGWPTGLIDEARRLGATAVRDEIAWHEVETVRRKYDFSRADPYMSRLLEQGLSPLIVFTGRNPLYDDGETPYSAEGRAAVAEFLSAVLTRYGADRVQLEIGNEMNSEDYVTGPFRENPPRYFAALVREVRTKLDADHPEARILCSGLNTISIAFLREFFRWGGLQDCDAISLHPYRDNPDTVAFELDRLRALMREYGGERPVYATEFGNWFDNPEDAPDYMMKLVAELASAGVAGAYWYALADEPWWPNMGLIDGAGKDKPAADAFHFLQGRLLPLGRPVARHSNSTVRVYEFGAGGRGFVIWGSGGQLSVSGDADWFDTRGRAIEPVGELSDQPVILLGQGLEVRVREPVPVADTKYQYNLPPWGYFARRPGIGLTPLEHVDWNWASFRGAPDLSPLKIGDDWITTARFADGPYHAVERFTAIATGPHRIEGWWEASPETEPSRLILRHNGLTVADGEITPGRLTLPGLRLTLQEGDKLDFEIAPTGPSGDGAVRRRIRISGPPIPE